jgi:hypothetical protein
MDYYQKQNQKKPKSRKFVGCLIGCLIAFGLLLLFLIVIAYLLFRAHPPVSEEQFFTPEIIGFARFQLDALQKEPARQLFRKILKNLNPPSQGKKGSDVDPEGLWNALDILFQKRHFFYLYQTREEDKDYLCVVNIKRLSWIFSAIIKDVKNAEIEKIPSPAKVKATCFRLKKADEPVFIAISSSVVLISNSESRLHNSLLLLRSEKPSRDLSPLAQSLLPQDNPLDMINGFLVWSGEWTISLYKNILEEYPESKDLLDPLYQIIAGIPVQGVQSSLSLSTTDVLELKASLQCPTPSEASLYAERLAQGFSSLEIPRDVHFSFQPEGRAIHVTILIPGVEGWLEKNLRK